MFYIVNVDLIISLYFGVKNFYIDLSCWWNFFDYFYIGIMDVYVLLTF